jgi:hypothetical protein
MRRSTNPGYGSLVTALPGAAVAAGTCLLLLVAACGPPSAPPDGATSASTSSSSTATGTATGTEPPHSAGAGAAGGTTASDTPAGTPGGLATSGTSPSELPSPTPSGWKTYTTSHGRLTFDYPGDLTIRDPAGTPPPGGISVEVSNEAGKPMASLQTNVVTGSECVQQYPFSVLDSEPMPALAEKGVPDENPPRFMFETRGDPSAPARTKETIAAYGITMIPEEAGTLACPIFLLFRWPPSGAMFGAGYDPAINATPGDASVPYLEKAKLYVETGEYRNIRRMITSLRPAG